MTTRHLLIRLPMAAVLCLALAPATARAEGDAPGRLPEPAVAAAPVKREAAKPKRRQPPPADAAVSDTQPCSPERTDVLNTSRTLSVGAPAGLQVGLKTYPQTLKLADHEVVLTFDDGPLPETTGKVLDALKAQCVHATFFLIGRNSEANPLFVRREIREGHSVGHHSWSHPDITLRSLSEDAGRQEIVKGIAADERAGYGADARPETPHVPFFRFPGFADTQPLLAFLATQKIAVFGADFWASDWLNMTPEAELKLVLSRLEAVGHGIILFHDTRPSTAAMLPDFLRELKARGYKVVHIVPGTDAPELERAPANWTSETDATVNRVLSKLLARAKPGAAQGGHKPERSAKPPESKGDHGAAPGLPD